jgi:hypothetical protein
MPPAKVAPETPIEIEDVEQVPASHFALSALFAALRAALLG